MRMMSFEKARQHVQGQSLKVEEWEKFCENEKPKTIPDNPQEHYYNNWVSWEDWIGASEHASIDTLLTVGKEIQKFLKTNEKEELDIESSDNEEKYLARWARRLEKDTKYHKDRLIKAMSSR